LLELRIPLTAAQALDECRRGGLVVKSERGLAGRPGSKHWHLRMPNEVGTLELSEWDGQVWVKIHPRREGEWTRAFARKLAGLQPSN
jgi:hypothetical protein